MSYFYKKLALLFLCVLLFTCLLTACSLGGQELVTSYQVVKNGHVIDVIDTVLVDDGRLSFEEKLTEPKGGFIYAEYTDILDAYKNADVVVYGKVKEIKEGICQERRDEFTDADRKGMSFYYTPIVIDVIYDYKGNVETDTVLYYSLGAISSDIVYTYNAFDTFGIDVGDEMVVFLTEQFGHLGSISPNTIMLADEDGNFVVTSSLLPDKYRADSDLSIVAADDFVKYLEDEFKEYLK